MRSLSFHAPYLSLTRFALSLTRRASSEPTATPSIPNHSPEEVLGETDNVDVPCSQPVQSLPETDRSPSPTPTEVEDPEPEVIIENLKKLNIKVRDFAYPSSSSRTPPPAPEIFDPYRAVAEYEYRLRTTPDIPIPGKTMRRLLSLGWVSMEEAKERLRQIDWEALKEYDAKDTGYPWRPVKWSAVPASQEREILYSKGVVYFSKLDKLQAGLRRQEEYEERERLRGIEMGERVELLLRETQEREWKKIAPKGFESSITARCEGEARRLLEKKEGEMGVVFPAIDDDDDNASFVPFVDTAPTISTISAGKKRALERSPSTRSTCGVSTDGPKRLKLSGEVTSSAVAGSSSQPPTSTPLGPYQQYPAPLHAYDPLLYPDAARIISAANRPPIVLSGSVTPPVSDDESDKEPGIRLRRKNKELKRLGRTQTFVQL